MRKSFIVFPLLSLIILSGTTPDAKSERFLNAQVRYLQGDEFIRQGITGKGVRIAILDGGFPDTKSHPALAHLVQNNQIVATRNFVNNTENVWTGVHHGTEVLACLAGRWGDRNMGLATDAEFLLALTEVQGEPRKEEISWAKAVEWAIQNGAKIIQSSLGYTYQRYFPEDLDGRRSIAAKAAAKAAAQGVLIVNCIGNEGLSKWKTMVTPADADSILSVGAIDPLTGLAAGFSSLGPTADRRLKPNVCAPGYVLVPSGKSGTKITQGSSFAAPLVAGFAACCWQLHPELDAMGILKMVEESGHLFPYYDYVHGYGIPQAERILKKMDKKDHPPIEITAVGSTLSISLPGKNAPVNDAFPEEYFYYHFSDPEGHLIRYGVYHTNSYTALQVPKEATGPYTVFRCFFNGQTKTWTDNR